MGITMVWDDVAKRWNNVGSTMPSIPAQPNRGGISLERQMHLQNPQAFPRQDFVPDWNPVETKTPSEALAVIERIDAVDPEYGAQLYERFNQLMDTPGNHLYNPYASPTNNAVVSELSKLGIDASNVTPDWLNEYKVPMMENLQVGIDGTPIKGKTKESKSAYYLYKLNQDEGNTQQVEGEWNALKQEIGYWANRTDLNLSDEEILAKVNIKENYPVLAQIDESRQTGSIFELNRPVEYSQDALLGAVWAARNETNGSAMSDAVQYRLGNGNSYKPDPVIRERRSPTSDKFNPYLVGSTMDDVTAYFGVQSINREWLDKHTGEIMGGDDETAKGMLKRAWEANDFTEAADKEAAELVASENATYASGKTRYTVSKAVYDLMNPKSKNVEALTLDEALEQYLSGKYPSLGKIAASLRYKSPEDTTRAIGFDYYGLKEYVLAQAPMRELERKLKDAYGQKGPLAKLDVDERLLDKASEMINADVVAQNGDAVEGTVPETKVDSGLTWYGQLFKNVSTWLMGEPEGSGGGGNSPDAGGGKVPLVQSYDPFKGTSTGQKQEPSVGRGGTFGEEPSVGRGGTFGEESDEFVPEGDTPAHLIYKLKTKYGWDGKSVPKITDADDLRAFISLNDKNAPLFQLMTVDELKKYLSLDDGQAENYLQQLGEERLFSENRAQIEGRSVRLAKEIPGVASVVSAGINTFIIPGESAQVFFEKLFYGKDIVKDDPRLSGATASGVIRQVVPENFSEFGKFCYSTGMSIVDNVINRGVFGPASLVTMGLSSSASTMQSALDRGATSDQALTLGAINAVVEAGTEKLQMDRFTAALKSVKGAGAKTLISNLFMGGLKSALPEAGEEGLSYIANLVADISVMGDKSETLIQHKDIMDAYIQKGYSPEDASNAAWNDVAANSGNEALMSMASGAASGWFFGDIAAIGSAYNSNLNSQAAAETSKNLGNQEDAVVLVSQAMNSSADAKTLKVYEAQALDTIGIDSSIVDSIKQPLGLKKSQGLFDVLRKLNDPKTKAERVFGALIKTADPVGVAKMNLLANALGTENVVADNLVNQNLLKATNELANRKAEQLQTELDKMPAEGVQGEPSIDFTHTLQRWGAKGLIYINNLIQAGQKELAVKLQSLPSFAKSVIVAEAQMENLSVDKGAVEAQVDALASETPDVIQNGEIRAEEQAVEVQVNEVMATQDFTAQDTAIADAQERLAQVQQEREVAEQAEADAVVQTEQLVEQANENPADEQAIALAVSALDDLEKLRKDKVKAFKAEYEAKRLASKAAQVREEAETKVRVESEAQIRDAFAKAKQAFAERQERKQAEAERTQGLIDEITGVGGVVSNGVVTLYHRTSKENADKIKATGVLVVKEDGAFFSTKPTGYADGYGDTVVKFAIPVEKLELDDVFADEAHLRLPTGKARRVNVSAYLQTDEQQRKGKADAFKAEYEAKRGKGEPESVPESNPETAERMRNGLDKAKQAIVQRQKQEEVEEQQPAPKTKEPDAPPSVQFAKGTGIDVMALASAGAKGIKSVQKIFEDLGKSIGLSFNLASKHFKRANKGKDEQGNLKTPGYYNVKSESVFTQLAQDINTVSHELGHHLDKTIKLSLLPEIRNVIDYIKANSDTSGYAETELPGEAVAEFVKAYMMNRNATIQMFGENLVNTLENGIREMKIWRPVQNAIAEITKIQAANMRQATEARIRVRKDGDTIRERLAYSFDQIFNKGKISTLLFDSTLPAQRITTAAKEQLGDDFKYSEDFRTLSLLNNRVNNFVGMNLNTMLVDLEGNPLDENGFFDLTKTIKLSDMKAFNNYKLMQHEQGRSAADKSIYKGQYTPEQVNALINEYEAEHPEWKETSDKIDAWWGKFFKEYVVNRGVVSQENYDKWRTIYPHYVPTYRVSDEFFLGKSRRKQGVERVKAAVKGGSDLDIEDPIGNMARMVMAYTVQAKQLQANVALVNQLRNVEGLGHIAVEVEHDMDVHNDFIKSMDAIKKTISDERSAVAEGSEADIALVEVEDAILDGLGKMVYTVKDKTTGGNIVNILMPDGKYASLMVQDSGVFDLLNNAPVSGVNAVLRAINKLTRLVSSTATALNPIWFGGKNVQRDLQTALMYGSTATNPVSIVAKWLKGMPEYALDKLAFSKGSDSDNANAAMAYKLFVDLGSKYVAPKLKNPNKMYKDMYAPTIGGKAVQVLNLPIDILAGMNEYLENNTRYMEFKHGKDLEGNENQLDTFEGIVKAAIASTGLTVDFGKHGSSQFISQMRLVTPFLNAALQGANKTIHAFGKDNAGRRGQIAAKFILNGVLLGISQGILRNLFWDDDEKKDVDDMDQNYVNENLLIKTGEQTFYRMPLSQDALFQGAYVIGKWLSNVFTGEGNDDVDYLVNSMIGIATNQTKFSTVANPMLNVLENKTWYGGPIESYSDLQYGNPAYRYDADTPKVFVDMSKSMPWLNLSPKKIEYLFQQYTGVYGKLLLKTTKAVMGGDSVPEAIVSTLKSQTQSSYFLTPAYSSQASDVLYTGKKTLEGLIKADKDGKEINEFGTHVTGWVRNDALREASELTKKGGALADATETISGLWDEHEAIGNDEQLTDEEKRERQVGILRKINDTALTANGILAEYEEKYFIGGNYSGRIVSGNLDADVEGLNYANSTTYADMKSGQSYAQQSFDLYKTHKDEYFINYAPSYAWKGFDKELLTPDIESVIEQAYNETIAEQMDMYYDELSSSDADEARAIFEKIRNKAAEAAKKAAMDTDAWTD